MRAVIKLERRFKRAISNLEAGTGGDANAEGKANISKQITVLEADISEKDVTLEKLGAEMTALTEQGVQSATKIADLEAGAKNASDEAAKLQAAVKQAKAAEAASVKQAQTLAENLKAAEAGGENAAEVAAQVTNLKAEVATLKSKLAETEANAENYFDRMRKLRGALRMMRTGLKENVLNAEDLNTIMQAELEALEAQRELDLNEVNIVLEKLTPLVEGK